MLLSLDTESVGGVAAPPSACTVSAWSPVLMDRMPPDPASAFSGFSPFSRGLAEISKAPEPYLNRVKSSTSRQMSVNIYLDV